MQRQLAILEVSQKQAYIFASRALKENMQRSADIARVTGSDFFEETCPRDFDRRVNLVYSGGGHTVVQFFTKEEADTFAKAVTTRVLREYPGMELFVQQHEYVFSQTPGWNLNELSRKLEIKKARRRASFRTHALGVERPEGAPLTDSVPANFKVPSGWKPTNQLEIIDKDDNFLAVVHVDGNSMGKRVQNIYDKCSQSWDQCVKLLQQFSEEIDQDFERAFDEMAEDLARALELDKKSCWKERYLPLRKLIGAGDDVCFITTGSMGMECAASFLRHLSNKKNGADQQYYTACAGVVLIHKKYPFRQAYNLSESLCSNAKMFVSKHNGSISALDFHIEFGQLKGSLAETRQDYLTDDGGNLELRPFAVTGEAPRERTYAYLVQRLEEMKRNSKGLARSKIKMLRGAFRQGIEETRLAMKMTNTQSLLAGNDLQDVFYTDEEGKRRCLYFDAIELLDVTALWQEVKR